MAKARAVVPAPQLVAPRYGLLASVPVAEAGTVASDQAEGGGGDTVGRWQSGFEYTPETAGGVGGTVLHNCHGSTDEIDADPEPDAVVSDPFVVWDADRCGTAGFMEHDWQGRATRALLANQSHHIARELWTGALLADAIGDGQDVDRPTLPGSAEVVATGKSTVEAIATLESRFARCSHGQRGMISLPPLLLAAVMMGDTGPYIIRDGGVLVTMLGTLVVADSGFGAGAPSGQSATNLWVYVSAVPRVRLDAIQLVPGTLDNATAYAQAMRRDVNDLTLRAERLAAFDFDPSCTFAVGTTTPATSL